MSVLDKAFIKAFHKGTRSESRNRARPHAGPQQPGLTSHTELIAPSACSDQASGDGQVNRVDPAHLAWTDQFAQPHSQVYSADGFIQLACVSNWEDVTAAAGSGRTHSSDDKGPKGAGSVDVAGAQRAEPEDVDQPAADPAPEAQSAGASSGTPRAAGESPQADDHRNTTGAAAPDLSESLQRAAAVTLPPVLELPEVFQTPDEEPSAQQAESGPEVFTPEWEVDRFAWPPICQALLEAQASYFEHVGTRLLAATEESSHVIMIGGSRRGEGRTTLALCLARCAAQAGVPVALVDADYQNPQLSALLRMEIPCSWLESVQRRAPLQEAAVSSVEDRLALFGLTDAESVSTAGDNAQLVTLLESISKHYPLVIVDAGPLDSEGGQLFANQAVCPIDTAIVVRDLRNTARESALAAARRMQQSGIQAVGIAENFLMAE